MDAYRKVSTVNGTEMFISEGPGIWDNKEDFVYTVKLVTKMQNWQFNPNEGDKAVSVEGSGDVVFYIDDLNPEVVAKIVETFNDGNDPMKVDAYLLDEERCTSDEREFIMEQINAYLKLTSGEPAATPAAGAQGADLDPKPLQQGENQQPPFTPDPAAKKPGEGEQKDQPQRTVRRRNTQNNAGGPASTTKKTILNPDDLVKQLEEKIQLVKILGAAEVPEIPTGLTKPSRDIMVEFQERQEALIAEFMERIQKM